MDRDIFSRSSRKSRGIARTERSRQNGIQKLDKK